MQVQTEFMNTDFKVSIIICTYVHFEVNLTIHVATICSLCTLYMYTYVHNYVKVKTYFILTYFGVTTFKLLVTTYVYELIAIAKANYLATVTADE